MTARAQVARLLAVVPLVARRGDLPVAEVAAALDTTPAQLVADLRVLIYCGLPGLLPGDLVEVDLDALDGEGIVRISNADFLTTPMRLSAAEATSLVVALRVLQGADDLPSDRIDRLLDKLVAVAGTSPVAVSLPAGTATRGTTTGTVPPRDPQRLNAALSLNAVMATRAA